MFTLVDADLTNELRVLFFRGAIIETVHICLDIDTVDVKTVRGFGGTDQEDDVLWVEHRSEMFDDDVTTVHRTVTVTPISLYLSHHLRMVQPCAASRIHSPCSTGMNPASSSAPIPSTGPTATCHVDGVCDTRRRSMPCLAIRCLPEATR